MSAGVVRVGRPGQAAVGLGGDEPVVIQTMWKEPLRSSDVTGAGGAATLGRLEALAAAGCGLCRFAVPDEEAAEVLGRLAGQAAMPLVADIHFDYRLALRCLDFPIAKLRINPGNIGAKAKVEAVLEKAADRGVPIRIGVNAGSLPQDLRRKVDGGASLAEALVEAALRELAVFDEAGFSAGAVVSMKASSPAVTAAANRLFAERARAPLHIGVTEAGPLVAGVARNAAALVPLLESGTGDTIRVSLSDTMENEVIAAREILLAASEGGARAERALGERGVRIVSCPRCGRCSFDTHAFTRAWQGRLYALKSRATVAVMGCAVNGPGEARSADLGITGAGGKTLIFRRGEVVRTLDNADADAAFAEELARLAADSAA